LFVFIRCNDIYIPATVLHSVSGRSEYVPTENMLKPIIKLHLFLQPKTKEEKVYKYWLLLNILYILKNLRITSKFSLRKIDNVHKQIMYFDNSGHSIPKEMQGVSLLYITYAVKIYSYFYNEVVDFINETNLLEVINNTEGLNDTKSNKDVLEAVLLLGNPTSHIFH